MQDAHMKHTRQILPSLQLRGPVYLDWTVISLCRDTIVVIWTRAQKVLMLSDFRVAVAGSVSWCNLRSVLHYIRPQQPFDNNIGF